MRGTLYSLWAEPRAADPPARVGRDWFVLGAVLMALVVEAMLHVDLVWRPVSIAVGFALAFTVLWRRTHPLLVVVVAFGAVNALDVASFLADEREVELYSAAFVLLLVYSLFRWGAGREAAIGLAVMLASALIALFRTYTGVGDAIGGLLVLLFPAVLGVLMRYQRTARRQQLEQFRLREREQLARELHDTVAHHVSAIVIQAQAGRVCAASASLEGAASALEVIEDEAARALAEMRSMVGILRARDTRPDLAPQPRIADICAFADSASGSARDALRIDVELSGDLDHLEPAVEAAVYRLAQESITNAIRHARHATRVDVRVVGDAETVRLTVSDDGDTTSVTSSSSGYGLVGMSERATLLGGSLEAGSTSTRGWAVQVVLPRRGSSP